MWNLHLVEEDIFSVGILQPIFATKSSEIFSRSVQKTSLSVRLVREMGLLRLMGEFSLLQHRVKHSALCWTSMGMSPTTFRKLKLDSGALVRPEDRCRSPQSSILCQHLSFKSFNTATLHTGFRGVHWKNTQIAEDHRPFPFVGPNLNYNLPVELKNTCFVKSFWYEMKARHVKEVTYNITIRPSD